ncbi:hypothetical protein Moror_12591 [Moniliophthora roreri MCA 2997]|uniref:Protein kinase domain-containing protein n=2 Tax=Moniliophthora roreri TaxID=221103 RepID=V2YVC6_MONRO|nr:hypothetical protein Moror_12591 [Moniliophthora roreri MCA 2997]
MTLHGKVVKVLRPFKPNSVLRSLSRSSKPSVDGQEPRKHEHLLLDYLLDYRQNHIEAYSFACKCVLLLQTSPHLLEYIASEFERVGMKFISTRRDTHTLEIATIAFQDDMFLCPVLAEAQQDIPLFTSLKGALACLESLLFDIEECMATVNSRWAPFVMEILQYYLDNDYCYEPLNSFHDLFREACIHCLVHLNRKYHALPTSFFLTNISREGDFPVSGGGYADIWKGYMNGSELICHKVLRIFTASFDEVKLLKDLSKEVLIWRQLRHPYIHSFLGICADLFRPSLSIISPWMEHGSITNFLEGKQGAHLGTEFKIQLIHQVAKGIQYLHEHEPPVIHGDIKGANILISNDFQCRITDFGISTMEIDHRFDASDSVIRGSIPWLAPELMNPEPVIVTQHAKSRDIYALGCTMMEILSGKPPFYDKKLDFQIMISVLQGDRPKRPPACPEWVYRIAKLCWDEKVSARPQADYVVHAFGEGMTEDGPPSPRTVSLVAYSEASDTLEEIGDAESLARSISSSMHTTSCSLYSEPESLMSMSAESIRSQTRASSPGASMTVSPRQWNRDKPLPPLPPMLPQQYSNPEPGSPTTSNRTSSHFGDTDVPLVEYRELWRDPQLRHAWGEFRERNNVGD